MSEITEADKKVQEGKWGFWLYSDGRSQWGQGIQNAKECPLKVSKEMHTGDIGKKVQYFIDETKAIEARRVAADKAEKAKEKGKK